MKKHDTLEPLISISLEMPNFRYICINIKFYINILYIFFSKQERVKAKKRERMRTIIFQIYENIYNTIYS